jgi:hypothetical protein
MASQTIAAFESPIFLLTYTYNDANGAITRFDWNNRGGGYAHCVLSRRGGDQVAAYVVPPGIDPATVTPPAGATAVAAVGGVDVPNRYKRQLTKGALESGDDFSLSVAWEPIRA